MALPTSPTVNVIRPDRARMILFGPPGHGKTSLAAGWYPASNLLIDTEGGTRFLSGEHYIERPKTYSDFTRIVNDLCQPGHQFTTVTVDTVDALVRLADAEAGQRGGKVAAGLVEFGKGMADRDGVVLRDLNRLLNTDLGVILCAHPATVTKKDDRGAESTRIFPRIDKDEERLRQPIIGMFDFMFAVHKRTESEREVITGGNATFETKRRTLRPIPDVLPADAGALYAALAEGCQPVAA